jgi:hypothetical protein
VPCSSRIHRALEARVTAAGGSPSTRPPSIRRKGGSARTPERSRASRSRPSSRTPRASSGTASPAIRAGGLAARGGEVDASLRRDHRQQPRPARPRARSRRFLARPPGPSTVQESRCRHRLPDLDLIGRPRRARERGHLRGAGHGDGRVPPAKRLLGRSRSCPTASIAANARGRSGEIGLEGPALGT